MNGKPRPRPCSVNGCGDVVHQREYCVMHYFRWRRTGSAYTQGNGFHIETRPKNGGSNHSTELLRSVVNKGADAAVTGRLHTTRERTSSDGKLF